MGLVKKYCSCGKSEQVLRDAKVEDDGEAFLMY
jgi:hypothetical protein